MIIMRFCFVVITALLMTAFGGVEPAAAEELLTYFVRELVIQSDEIVVARPAVPRRIVGKNVRFVVSEVLQGRRIVAGETITVADLSYYHLGEPPFFRRPSAARPPSCDKALLFINPKRTRRGEQEVDCEFDLYESGMRLLTGDAEVLLPLQFIKVKAEIKR